MLCCRMFGSSDWSFCSKAGRGEYWKRDECCLVFMFVSLLLFLVMSPRCFFYPSSIRCLFNTVNHMVTVIKENKL